MFSRETPLLARELLVRGDIKIPHSRMTKTCWETLMICIRQVTKGVFPN